MKFRRGKRSTTVIFGDVVVWEVLVECCWFALCQAALSLSDLTDEVGGLCMGGALTRSTLTSGSLKLERFHLKEVFLQQLINSLKVQTQTGCLGLLIFHLRMGKSEDFVRLSSTFRLFKSFEAKM